jgi:hypothetical protein
VKKKPKKVQVKINIERPIHEKLMELCERTRRTPSSMVEFMTLETDRAK